MAGDANYATRSLLLHCNGANGSTTLTDNSITPKTPASVAGGAQISTAQSQFGGASLYLDGTGDYVTYASHADFAFGTGDFTVEHWFYTASSGTMTLIDMRPNSTTNGAYFNTYMTAGVIYYYVNTGVRITGTAVSYSAWHHVAICRSSGVTKLFVDGVQQGSDYTDSTNYLASTIALGGAYNGVGLYTGYLDEFRVTKGRAEYTTTFTPPASAFLDYAAQASGTVLSQAGAPAARTVRAYRRDTGALVASTTSDGSGAYSINLPTTDELTIVALDDQVSGTYYNDRVIRVIPA